MTLRLRRSLYLVACSLALAPASLLAAANPPANAAPLYLAAIKQAAKWQTGAADPALAQSVMQLIDKANALSSCHWPADALSQHTPLGSFNLGSPPAGLVKVLTIEDQAIKADIAAHRWTDAWQHARAAIIYASRSRTAAGVSNLLTVINAEGTTLSTAQQCLAAGAPAPASHADWQQLLSPASLWQDTARTILHDRDAVSNADQNGNLRTLMFYTDQPSDFPSDDDLQQSLDLMKKAAKLAKAGDYPHDLTADSDNPGISMTQTVLSALNAAASTVRAEAKQQQAFLLALAIQQYQITHHHWPKSLASLARNAGDDKGFTYKPTPAAATLSWWDQKITITKPLAPSGN